MNISVTTVTIVPFTDKDVATVIALAQRFNMPWTPAEDSSALRQYRYHLLINNRCAELISPDTTFKPIKLSFIDGRNTHRRLFGGRNQQLIARAIGSGKKTNLNVLDGTAGFGTDAFVLASLGCNVTLIERIPALATMLELAVEEANQHSATERIASRMQVVFGDAVRLFKDSRYSARFDTVYLDPMYPKSNKSALVKKNMQVLRDLVGFDDSGEDLLRSALNCALMRVVVKRPRGAPTLSGRTPSFVLKSAKTRYDIYTINP